MNINVPVATKLRSVTPSDSAIITCAALYVGGAGNVAIVAEGDSDPITLLAVPAGTTLHVACKQVMATNTTATGIVALIV